VLGCWAVGGGPGPPLSPPLNSSGTTKIQLATASFWDPQKYPMGTTPPPAALLSSDSNSRLSTATPSAGPGSAPGEGPDTNTGGQVG